MVLGTLSGEIFEVSDFDGSNVHKGPVALGEHGRDTTGVDYPCDTSSRTASLR